LPSYRGYRLLFPLSRFFMGRDDLLMNNGDSNVLPFPIQLRLSAKSIRTTIGHEVFKLQAIYIQLIYLLDDIK
jgi:hypothetical protein